MNRESSSKTHLPGVKAHLEGGRGKNTSGVSSGSPEVDNIRNGFTLAEILVVMAIVGIVGMIMVVIFANTLRGSNKSQILAVIKQNGQAVLENMDKTIRNADNVICPTSDPSNTIVVVKDGIYTRYRIVRSGSTGVGTAPVSCLGSGANGCIAQDNPVKIVVLATGKLQTDAAFIIDVCLSGSLMPRDATQPVRILTDTNPQSGVSVNTFSFTRSRQSGSKDNITVSFTLGPGVAAPSSIAGQIDPVTFQTTVQLR